MCMCVFIVVKNSPLICKQSFAVASIVFLPISLPFYSLSLSLTLVVIIIFYFIFGFPFACQCMCVCMCVLKNCSHVLVVISIDKSE